MATKEFWVILPFNNKETAKNALQEQLYEGFIVEKPAGSWKTERKIEAYKEISNYNFEVRSE
jgi:hypothetical protein